MRISKEVYIGFFASFSEAFSTSLLPFLLPFLTKVMLPGDPYEVLLKGYSLLSLSAILAYPLGSIYFGYLGDKFGRKSSCTYSTLGLGVTTILIALTPESGNVQTILIFLFITSFAQQFFAGGEYYSVIIFSLEHSKTDNKSLISGLSSFFSVLGLACAQYFVFIVQALPEIVPWQIGFLFSGVLCVSSFIIKLYCKESPGFSCSYTSLDFFQSNSKTLTQAFFMTGLFCSLYSFIFVFLPAYQELNNIPIGVPQGSLLITYGVCVLACGYLSHFAGSQRIMSLGIILFITSFINEIRYMNFTSLQVQLILSASLFIGPIHFWNASRFKQEERCRGMLIGSGIGGVVFFGLTTPVCLKLQELTGSIYGTLIYILPQALICLFILRPNKEQDMSKSWSI